MVTVGNDGGANGNDNNIILYTFASKKGFSKILPNNKVDTGHHEGCWGFIFEAEGYDLTECSLFGEFMHDHGPHGRCGVAPHNTSWQKPVEKFYASLKTNSDRGFHHEMKQ